MELRSYGNSTDGFQGPGKLTVTNLSGKKGNDSAVDASPLPPVAKQNTTLSEAHSSLSDNAAFCSLAFRSFAISDSLHNHELTCRLKDCLVQRSCYEKYFDALTRLPEFHVTRNYRNHLQLSLYHLVPNQYANQQRGIRHPSSFQCLAHNILQ